MNAIRSRLTPGLTASLLALTTLLAACASTRLVDAWKDPAFAGPPFKQLLVFGVSNSDVNRRVFEDGFVRALQASGTGGVPANTVLPEKGSIPNDRVTEAMQKTGSDGVLVTRVLRVKRDVQVTGGYGPGYYGRGWGGYYGGAWASMPPDVNVYDVLTLESTLWNIKADKPVWTGTSEVTDPSNVQSATDEVAKVLIARMKADGVI
jgi:hypothetical protein